MINILQVCRASPAPSCTVADFTLPITYFDVFWLNFHQVERLLFYNLPITKSSFIETIIPNLKNSLSLVLQHYLPLAGNSVYPLQEHSGLPFLRYKSGDSVPLIFAESSDDFHRLSGNQPRNCDDFHPLIPELPAPYVSNNSKITPLFAVQVTLFPNKGISIGITNQHGVGDGGVIVDFVKAWGSINKFDGDSHLVDGNLLPFYNRSVIKDPYDLTTKFLKFSMHESSKPVSVIHANKVRTTFVLTQSNIQNLKNYILKKRPVLSHVSSFTVTCAYIWTCWFKAKDSVDDVEFLILSVDCRSRLDPPIPTTYFGNCLVPCGTSLTREELLSKDGFLVASEKIGESIHQVVNDKQGISNGSVHSKLRAANGKRAIGVAGTTKKDIYDADFGWGRAEKYEVISIDREESMSLNKSGKEENGFEVGLCMPEKQMEAFQSIFAGGLGNLQ